MLQTPGMPQSTPFTASLSRAPSAPQRPQNTFQPQGARQQTPMSFQQRTSRGPDQMPRPRPSVPGYGHPAGRPPYRPPSSPSSNSSVSGAHCCIICHGSAHDSTMTPTYRHGLQAPHLAHGHDAVYNTICKQHSACSD